LKAGQALEQNCWNERRSKCVILEPKERESSLLWVVGAVVCVEFLEVFNLRENIT